MEVITHHNIKLHMINHFTFLSFCRTWRTWDKHHSQLILWLSALKLLLTFNIQDEVKTQNSHIMPLHGRISNHLHYKYLKQNNLIKIPTRRAWVSKGRYQSNRFLLTNSSIISLTTNTNQLEAKLSCPCWLIAHKLQTLHVICTESVSQGTTLYCLGVWE